MVQVFDPIIFMFWMFPASCCSNWDWPAGEWVPFTQA